MRDILLELQILAGTERRNWFAWDSLSLFIAIILGVIEANVWSPAQGYLTVVALIVADFITGVSLAAKRKQIETRKAMRIVYKIIAYTTIMAFAHNLAKNEPLLFWLTDAVFFPIALILFLSLIKNLSLLGYIPKDVATMLYKNIDKYKNNEPDKE